MTAEEIHSHLHATGTLAWGRALCEHATIDDLDADAIERYLNLRDERSRTHLRHMPREEMLL
jgi:hypothetical protein